MNTNLSYLIPTANLLVSWSYHDVAISCLTLNHVKNSVNQIHKERSKLA